MVNFNKLRQLIGTYEKRDQMQQIDFFKRLHSIATIEMQLRQEGLSKWF